MSCSELSELCCDDDRKSLKLGAKKHPAGRPTDDVTAAVPWHVAHATHHNSRNQTPWLSRPTWMRCSGRAWQHKPCKLGFARAPQILPPARYASTRSACPGRASAMSHLTLFHPNLSFFRLLAWPPSSLKCHCTLHDVLLTEFYSIWSVSVSVSMHRLNSVHVHSYHARESVIPSRRVCRHRCITRMQWTAFGI